MYTVNAVGYIIVLETNEYYLNILYGFVFIFLIAFAYFRDTSYSKVYCFHVFNHYSHALTLTLQHKRYKNFFFQIHIGTIIVHIYTYILSLFLQFIVAFSKYLYIIYWFGN